MTKIFVNHWNFHHKNVLGLKMIIKYANLELVNSIEDADIIYSSDVPLDSTKYRNKKFIFGPQFSIFPEQSFFNLNNKYNNTVYIVPSLWTKEFFIEFGANKSNVEILQTPFPVDINKFSPQNLMKDKIFIYFKNRNQKDLKYITKFLESKNINPIVFEYSKYSEENYIKTLHESLYGIWISGSESQGFALQEALSTNIPLIVWNVNNFSQNYGYNDTNVKTPVTSLPYWSDICGEIFYTEDEFLTKYETFILNLNKYQPRKYILDNLDVENCYNKYWKKLF